MRCTPCSHPPRPAEVETSGRDLAGNRSFLVYYDRDGTKFYIITEHDRSVTTVLLPEDY